MVIPAIQPPINILGFCENSVSCTGLGAHLPPYVRKQVNPWEEGTSSQARAGAGEPEEFKYYRGL